MFSRSRMRSRPRRDLFEGAAVLELAAELLVDPARGGVFARELLEVSRRCALPRRARRRSRRHSSSRRTAGTSDSSHAGDRVQIGEVRGDRRRRGRERLEGSTSVELDRRAQPIEQRLGRGVGRMDGVMPVAPRHRGQRDHARDLRGRRHQPLQHVIGTPAIALITTRSAGKPARRARSRDLRTDAHEHDRRAVDDRLVVRRDLDRVEALGEAAGEPGVARREQHRGRVRDVLAEPCDDRLARSRRPRARRRPPAPPPSFDPPPRTSSSIAKLT